MHDLLSHSLEHNKGIGGGNRSGILLLVTTMVNGLPRGINMIVRRRARVVWLIYWRSCGLIVCIGLRWGFVALFGLMVWALGALVVALWMLVADWGAGLNLRYLTVV